MKKHLMFSALVMGAAAAFAESSNTDGANVFAVMPVNTSAEEVIVAVPWLGASSDGSQSIQVKDIVKTANLNENDMLYAYIDGGYKAWKLNSSGEWEGVQIAKADGVPASAAGANETLTRGHAIILKRNAPIADCFYIYGQVASTSTADLTIAAGTSTTAAYTLIAPPLAGDCDDLNNYIEYKSGTPGAGDRIWVPTGNGSGHMQEYVYNNGSWGMYKRTGPFSQQFVSGVAIPAGQGAWYESNGGSPTISWKNLPSTSN